LKQSIQTKISSAIALIVLLSVAIISFLANYFINKQFTEYISRDQELKIQVITSSLSGQYDVTTKKWNVDYIDAIGMNSLYEGYIIKVYDSQNHSLWDAQAHDMSLCKSIMDDISERMKIKYPQLEGEFIATRHNLLSGKEVIGSVSISYFGPFFLNENDFRFLNELNTILVSIGAVAIALSIFVGFLLARRLSSPILNTVEATKQIADGNYSIRLKEKSNTKELDLLTGSINHLAASLQNLEMLRKQLTADVAHELRTPISILQAHIEAMIDGIWEPTPERLQSCYDETGRIGKLVKDLENLAKIESDKLKLEKAEINLHELIHKMIISFESNLKNKNLAAEVKGPDITVYADPDRIKQVVVNLLSNAIKYSSSEGIILFETIDEDEFSGFRITDQGIGIPEEELPYIFERFYRADKSRNRLTGGSGIGLTIVKSIIEAHGGSVRVESKVNKGSCFTVLLPKII
jgi:signal transduction histidine kinase